MPAVAVVIDAFTAEIGDKWFGCVNLIGFEHEECIEAYWLDYTVMSAPTKDEICREVFTDDDKALARYKEVLKALVSDMAKYASAL